MTNAKLHHPDYVPIAPLREAFERSGITKSELARRLGWMTPNISRVSDTLGYKPRSSGTRSERWRQAPQLQQVVRYDIAVSIADALAADLVALGL